jgi:hypothetical protein
MGGRGSGRAVAGRFTPDEAQQELRPPSLCRTWFSKRLPRQLFIAGICWAWSEVTGIAPGSRPEADRCSGP